MKRPVMIVSALLAVTLISLGFSMSRERVVASASANELFPDLYVGARGAFSSPEQPTAYLTFDDGPSKITEKILDILLEKNIQATFFVSGQNEDKEFAGAMLRRMHDEGHTIALHTLTHEYRSIYRSVERFLEDANAINEFIIKETAVRPTLLRFPGGSRSSNASDDMMRSIAREITRRGYIFHDWTVASNDDGSKDMSPQDIADRVISEVKGRHVEIILFHDNPGSTSTPDALHMIIPALLEMGYTFDRMTDSTPPTQFIKISEN